MKIIKEKTVAFTGAETLRTSDKNEDKNLENVIRTELSFVFADLYLEGKDIYIGSISTEFEMIFAEALLEYKKERPGVRLFVIDEAGRNILSPAHKRRFKSICESADKVDRINGSDNVTCAEALFLRNNFMLNHSSEIVTYSTEKESLKIIEEAERKGLPVLNLYDALEDYFALDSEVKSFLQHYTKVPNMRYGREGILLEGCNRPFPVEFNLIDKVESNECCLIFTLKNNIVITKSIISENCMIETIDGKPLSSKQKWL